MSKYTLELGEIHRRSHVKIFNFEYDFYTTDPLIKSKFEEKFIYHYFYDEIGFETIGKFKHRLRGLLNEIMPYYSQLYQTELASKDINFLLNKDLKETTTRDLTSEDNRKNISTSTNNTTANTTATENSDFKESSLNNGNATLSNNDLTTVNNTSGKGSTTSSSNDNGNTTTNGVSTGTEKEIVSFTSQGNIGITSSAELLEKWRKVIINIDQQIINECSDLFMKIY